jgi:hypothetical protein
MLPGLAPEWALNQRLVLGRLARLPRTSSS